MESYRYSSSLINLDGTSKEAVKKIGGDPRSRTAKCVCETNCNNGWMSRLQEKAKPTVIPLLTGEKTRITKSQQKSLAAWVSMMVMCSDGANKQRSISQHDRDTLYKHGVPPRQGWRIWIGRYQRNKWAPHWGHHVLNVVPEEHGERAIDGATDFNTQSTTYTVGELYVHAISSSYKKTVRLMRLVRPASDLLYEIWPPAGFDIDWPPPRPLSDQEAHNISVAFFENLRAIGSNNK